MLYATVFLYVLLVYLSCKNKKYIVLVCTPIYAVLFLYLIFSSFFIKGSINKFEINVYLLLITITYFYMEFFLFGWVCRRGFFFIVACCFFISIISYSGILIPMNIIILLYPDIPYILPKFNTPFFNLFFIYVFVLLFFYLNGLRSKVLLTFVFVTISITSKWGVRAPFSSPKIAVVQVGLYYEKGGTSSSFINDLREFLKKNKADIVVFSENMFYGYKSKYNKEKTSKLLNDINSLGLYESHAFLFNFYGFHDINNVVTVFKHKNKTVVNQKQVLIPYIEKKGLLNAFESIDSSFLSVNSDYDNKSIVFDKWVLNTNICYDALFPQSKVLGNVNITQSDYRQLNHGYGYDNTLKFGAILSKFSNAINSNLFVNVQNYGGTIVIDNKWNINNEIFSLSKREPFFILE